MIHSGLLSQPSDTVCITRANAVKLLTKAEQAKILEERQLLLLQDIEVLNLRINEKEAIVSGLKQKDSLNKEVIKLYDKEISVMKDQRKIFEGQIKYDNKMIRKLKRKIFFTSLSGVAIVGALTYLYLSK